MLPVVFAVAHRLGGGVLRYGLPAAGAFSVMHIFLPPHPGPVSAATFFDANIGLVADRRPHHRHPHLVRHRLPLRPVDRQEAVLPVPGTRWATPIPRPNQNPPRFRTVVGVLLLPLVLIFLNTGLSTMASAGALPASAKSEAWFQILRTLGETPVALLIAVLVAMFVLGSPPRLPAAPPWRSCSNPPSAWFAPSS